MAAYEVLLLNTAIPQIQAAQSGDTYVVPRDIAFSAALTLSAGTANGVPYLNGSKVLTTGSALTFDGTTFENTSGGGQFYGTVQAGVAGAINGRLRAYTAASDKFIEIFADGTTSIINSTMNSGVGGPLAFLISDTEQMRLTSTGLGIGTSNPQARLEIAQSADNTDGPKLRIANNGNTLSNGQLIGGIDFFDGDDSGEGVGAYIYSYTTDSIGQAGGQDLRFAAGTTERMRLDSSGNLGLGVTPSAYLNTVKAIDISAAGAVIAGSANIGLAANAFLNSSGNWIYKNSSTFAAKYTPNFANNGSHIWEIAPSGTAGAAISFTQAMTLDASGNLVVGATSTSSRFEAVAGTGAQDIARFRTGDATAANNAGGGFYANSSATAGSRYAYLWLDADGANFSGLDYFSIYKAGNSGGVDITNSSNSFMAFGTNNTERARITAGGYFKASNAGTYIGSTGSYHEFVSNSAAEIVSTRNTNASPYGLVVEYSAADPNGTGNAFLACFGSGATLRAAIRSNGGLANYQSNNVDLSDIRTKTDINPLASYWNKIAALEIVSYKYKDQTHNDLNIGVIAQQVEQVAPEFVDADGFGETPEDGVPLKTIYNKDLTFAAIKALQEAMARIEKLEAEVAALKGA